MNPIVVQTLIIGGTGLVCGAILAIARQPALVAPSLRKFERG